MSPLATQEIHNNIYSVKTSFVNMFLVEDSSHYIAIDAGNNLDEVSIELEKLTINPDKVVAVFLTHFTGRLFYIYILVILYFNAIS